MVLEERDDSADASPSTWRPSFDDWTMIHTLLADIRDLTVRAHFTKPADFPRPLSALDVLREELEEARLQSGYDRVLDEVSRAQQRWREMGEDERHALGDVG